MAITITRTAWVDDDGSGTTGTVINNAAKTSLYDQIDGLFDGTSTFALGGKVTAADHVGLAAAKKLYLDGVALTGDTYVTESSANVLSLYSGGVDLQIASGVLTLKANAATYGFIGDGSNGLGLAATHASGAIRFYSGGSTERMRIHASGGISICNTTDNGAGTVWLSGAGGYGMPTWGTTASAANAWVGDGNYLLRSTSSLRWKTDIVDLDRDDALTALQQLRPITYRGSHHDHDHDDRRYVGLIAEEVAPIAPLLATYDEGGESGTPNYVTYDRLPAYLIVGWQQHDAQIASLAARIAALEEQSK